MTEKNRWPDGINASTRTRSPDFRPAVACSRSSRSANLVVIDGGDHDALPEPLLGEHAAGGDTGHEDPALPPVQLGPLAQTHGQRLQFQAEPVHALRSRRLLRHRFLRRRQQCRTLLQLDVEFEPLTVPEHLQRDPGGPADGRPRRSIRSRVPITW